MLKTKNVNFLRHFGHLLLRHFLKTESTGKLHFTIYKRLLLFIIFSQFILQFIIIHKSYKIQFLLIIIKDVLRYNPCKEN